TVVSSRAATPRVCSYSVPSPNCVVPEVRTVLTEPPPTASAEHSAASASAAGTYSRSISLAATSTSPLPPSSTVGPATASSITELIDQKIPPMNATGATTTSSTIPMISGNSPRCLRRGAWAEGTGPAGLPAELPKLGPENEPNGSDRSWAHCDPGSGCAGSPGSAEGPAGPGRPWLGRLRGLGVGDSPSDIEPPSRLGPVRIPGAPQSFPGADRASDDRQQHAGQRGRAHRGHHRRREPHDHHGPRDRPAHMPRPLCQAGPHH